VGNIGAGGKIYANCRRGFQASIILSEASADFRGLDADDSVVRGVVVHGAPEHLSAEHAFAQTIKTASQGVFYHKLQKILRSLATFECLACENVPKLIADLGCSVQIRCLRHPFSGH
jgi:hypothetical protein